MTVTSARATDGAFIDGRFVPAHAPGITAVPAEDEAVLLEDATPRLHLLNTTGALLWSFFDGTSTVAEITVAIAEELGLPFERVLRDAVTITNELVARALVVDARAPRVRDDRRNGETPIERPILLDEPPNP